MSTPHIRLRSHTHSTLISKRTRASTLEQQRALYDRAFALRELGLTWKRVQTRLGTARITLNKWAKQNGWEVIA